MCDTHPFDKSHIVLRKLLSDTEYNFITKCRKILFDLTGETFAASRPAWLTFAGMQLESECYNERLKIAVDFTPATVYKLPQELAELYSDRVEYDKLTKYIGEAYIIATSKNRVNVISISQIMDDAQLYDFLRNKLHEMTQFRMWVGAPRSLARD